MIQVIAALSLLVADFARADDSEVVAGPAVAGERPAPDATEGARLFRQACATCHGIAGDGKGPAARFMRPAPRDLTEGVVRFRSTRFGQAALPEDLYRTIASGLRGTPMPGFSGFANDEIWQLVYHVQSLSDAADAAPHVVDIPPSPPISSALLARGAEVYGSWGCAACHGATGRGDGPTAGALVITSGVPVTPADLTRPEQFKRGTDPVDLHQTIATGLNGTPMPGFEGMPADDRWALVHWILSSELR